MSEGNGSEFEERFAAWKAAVEAAGNSGDRSALDALVSEGAALARELAGGEGGEEGLSRELAGALAGFANATGAGRIEAARSLLEHAPDSAGEPARKPVEARAVPDVTEPRSPALLRLYKQPGSLLSIGTVGVLSGEGGLGKSALASSVALALAHQGGKHDTLKGGIFEAPTGGGPVLLVQWEDEPAVTRDSIEAAAKLLKVEGAESRVYLMGMDEPIFGIPEGASLNTAPARLPAWSDVWAAVEKVKARLVVIDPAMAAFAANPNDVGAVRAFVTRALGEAAREHGCAVLVVAHSTKKGREKGGPFDPGQIAGSGAWFDGVRSVLFLGRDEEDPELVKLAVVKANHGPARLRIGLEPLRVEHGPHKGAIVAFDAGRREWEPVHGAGRKSDDDDDEEPIG